MAKYSFEFKLKLVKENEEGYGRRFLSSKYGVKDSTIANWIRQYKMYGENGLRRSMSKSKYTREFKLSVLKYRQYHELSYRETAEHFKIKNHSIIAINDSLRMYKNDEIKMYTLNQKNMIIILR